ncbi:hypothetical protein ACQ4LE_000736 [Meloidogyne hapla]|uniref:Uncharacterized protein n=1 Tax=Meloidogyne hapla TaxID=6305 RepID=A0A1I8B9L1_MELHA
MAMRRLLINFNNLKTFNQTTRFLTNGEVKTATTSNSDNLNETATELVQSIIEEYESNGRILTLPWADQQAINSALYPFKELLKLGIRPEFLEDACSRHEKLFRSLIKNGQCIYQMLQIFVENFHMTYEDSIRMFAKWCDLLENETPQSIQNRISLFSGRGFATGIGLRRIFEKCPELLFGSEVQKMDICLEQISNFFETGDLKTIVNNSPNICLMDPTELENKYEYIYFHMGFVSDELAKSKGWVNLDLFSIIDRHQLLCKTGKYFYPDPKKPQLKKENPSAELIFDTHENRFAKMIAGVEHEEWLIFKELCEQQRRLEDKEEPFEKIKPSMRKAFERRLKEKRENQEGEIE